MTDIDQITLRRLDFTVLLVFLGLMRHRKAVTVAMEMGMTQSSISHSLRRLRDVFQDPLFLRRPHGLEPTAHAITLEPHIRQCVDLLQGSLSHPPSFDPSRSDKLLRLSALDQVMATRMPSFLKSLTAEAPNMRITGLSQQRDVALASLKEAQIDLALGYFWELASEFIQEDLYEENYMVVARQGHPLMTAALTPDQYANARHIVVSPKGDLSGTVDTSLAAVGLTREVVVAMPLFLPALAIVAKTDLIATVPSSLASEMASKFELAVCPPPVAIRPFTISAVRHRRDLRNPLLDWVVDMLRQSLPMSASGQDD